MLSETLGPRSERTPKRYAEMVLGAVMLSLMELGDISDQDQFSKEFVDPVAKLVGQGQGGDTLFQRYMTKRSASTGAAIGAHKDSCSIVIAFCIQAIWADEDGDTSAAWTYVADGLSLVGAVRSVPLVREESIHVQKRNGFAGAAAKLANDPKQRAKTKAKKLWQERRAGKHPKLRTQEQFAAEVMRRWPELTSSRVICGWCTQWNKEAKSQRAS